MESMALEQDEKRVSWISPFPPVWHSTLPWRHRPGPHPAEIVSTTWRPPERVGMPESVSVRRGHRRSSRCDRRNSAPVTLRGWPRGNPAEELRHEASVWVDGVHVAGAVRRAGTGTGAAIQGRTRHDRHFGQDRGRAIRELHGVSQRQLAPRDGRVEEGGSRDRVPRLWRASAQPERARSVSGGDLSEHGYVRWPRREDGPDFGEGHEDELQAGRRSLGQAHGDAQHHGRHDGAGTDVQVIKKTGQVHALNLPFHIGYRDADRLRSE